MIKVLGNVKTMSFEITKAVKNWVEENTFLLQRIEQAKELSNEVKADFKEIDAKLVNITEATENRVNTLIERVEEVTHINLFRVNTIQNIEKEQEIKKGEASYLIKFVEDNKFKN